MVSDILTEDSLYGVNTGKKGFDSMSRARAATVSTDTDEAEILKNHLAHAKTLLREALRCLHTGDELPIAALAARAPDCLEARVYRFLYPQIAELNAETSGRTR